MKSKQSHLSHRKSTALSIMIGLATLFGCMPQADPGSLLDSAETLPGFKDGVLSIRSITPTKGLVGRETIVLLRGEGFIPGMTVRFGGTPSDQVIVYSDGMATAKVPHHGAGVVDLGLEALVAQANREVGIAEAFTYLDPNGGGGMEESGTDTDGDGLTDIEELEGWLIKIDPFGFGLDSRNTTNSGAAVIVTFSVASDPEIADTDGDGLNDGEEFVIKTNPQDTDTDDDGLWDGEEFNRWRTSPVSVDTDGDARSTDPSSSFSTLPPNPLLFDGAELFDIDELLKDPTDRGDTKLNATSPTLADTDGDGVSDFDEIDTPFRTPWLADMPQLIFEIVDDVDIRLDIEYAEEEGQSTSFEASFTTAESRSLTESQSNTVSNSVTVGAQVSIGVDDIGVSSSVDVTTGYEQTWATDVESSVSSEQTFSQIEEKSRTHTETAASGSMITGIRVSNIGNISVQVIDLGFTVRQWQPNRSAESSDTSPGQYRTFAELTPDLGPGLTLSPGSDSGVLQAVASDINPDRVKAFLARPDSLQIEPAAFELVNEAGINFAFIEEVTRARTARVSIDFGDGRFEEYRIATNVGRNADGSLAGITLDRVMDLTVGVGNWEAQHLEFDGADDCPDAVPVFEGATPFSIENATTDGPPDCSGDNFGNDIWYRYLPTFSGTLTIDTCADQDFDSILSAYTGDFDDCGSLVQIGCDDDGCPDGLQSIIEVEVTQGEEILIRVGSYLPDRGVGILTLTGPTGNFDTLIRVRDVESDLEAPRFWSVFLSGDNVVGGQGFSQTTLHAGDTVLIALSQDNDGDGLFAAQEQQYGSSDEAVDTDGDGLTDPEEVARQYRIDGELFEGGWNVRVTQRDASVVEYRTYSDPLRVDTDQDGIDDSDERLGLDGFPPGHKNDTNDATDPTLSDTDGDGLTDDVDPAPTFAARIMYVHQAGSNGKGLTWATARRNLHTAMTRTTDFNGDQDLTNDVSEIWVAQGEYRPATGTSYSPPAGVSIYGGFQGGEDRLAQRVADGAFNETVLRGRQDQAIFKVGSSGQHSVVDGFRLEGPQNTREDLAIDVGTDAVFRNLFVTGFEEFGAVWVREPGAMFEDCTFANNSAHGSTLTNGGAVTLLNSGGVQGAATFDRCTFSNNQLIDPARVSNQGGGAINARSGTTLTLRDCRFLNNTVESHGGRTALGGAVRIQDGEIINCEFSGNRVSDPGIDDEIWTSRHAGGALAIVGEVTVIDSKFFGNQSLAFGGALFVSSAGDARLFNCTFADNRVSRSSGVDQLEVGLDCNPNCLTSVWDIQSFATGAAIGVLGNLEAVNCIFWGNTSATSSLRLNGTEAGNFNTDDIEISLGQEIQISTSPNFSDDAFLPIVTCLTGGNRSFDEYDWPITSGGTILTRNCAILGLGHVDALDPNGCYTLSDPYFPGTANGAGNINLDPQFVNLVTGDLRLGSSSPAIDRGATLIDSAPFTAGFQPLPLFDLAGNLRVIDGNGDGNADVDMGAYEVQGDE